MATLSSIYIKKETLQKMLDVLNKKQGDEGKGISITISQNDESNQYGQNVSSWVSQSKEQREAKKERFFIGNGKVFWSNCEAKIANQNTVENNTKEEEEPF